MQLRSGCESVTTLVAPHHMATSSGKSLSVHPLAGEEVCVGDWGGGTTRTAPFFQTERKAPIMEAVRALMKLLCDLIPIFSLDALMVSAMQEGIEFSFDGPIHL